MLTTKTHKKLTRDAFRKFGQIQPIGEHKSLCDPRNFTKGYGRITGGKLIFWFETPDKSTHIIIEDMDKIPN